MKTGLLSGGAVRCLIGALVLAAFAQPGAHAQDSHSRGMSPKHAHPTPKQKAQEGAFVELVRESTARFRDVSVAVAEGYALQFGCVSGPDAGAMGMHYVNGALVADPALDPTRPELLVYEPLPDGRLRLVAADYLVIADAWHARQAATPELMGQLFHLFESPNRFGLPAFYTLHVWAWKENPNGTFVNWNPKVSCDAYAGQEL
jgi:hypothetical protein